MWRNPELGAYFRTALKRIRTDCPRRPADATVSLVTNCSAHRNRLASHCLELPGSHEKPTTHNDDLLSHCLRNLRDSSGFRSNVRQRKIDGNIKPRRFARWLLSVRGGMAGTNRVPYWTLRGHGQERVRRNISKKG